MSEWISVKDRLPEDPMQECAVLWEAFGGSLHSDIAKLNDRWNGKVLWSGQRGAHNDVRYWIPLPPRPAT
jgi:hypothetical protein